jgi:hypothetical protein
MADTENRENGFEASAAADVTRLATDIISGTAADLGESRAPGVTEAGEGGGKGGGTGGIVTGDSGDITKAFVGLPIEALICGPIIAAAKGQQQLCAIYVDTVMKLAFVGGDEKQGTNQLAFKYTRPVVDQTTKKVTAAPFEIDAPLLSLVPVPAFTMSELTVDFNMEVKNSDLQDDKTHEDVKAHASFNSWWGLDVDVTGNISSDSEHKRQTDSSATYHINARAVQQPPSEGMAKLTSLFAQGMEPIPLSK